ncbi:hypothetical protein DY000_02010209 [Brassica cretica]|uniref:Uncharacterized protein n=1 Tax=Brassica cretica TaxID=69181 RepID=A0ABQ7CC15_BRACR|nr:hypothetical protein DY000_02010209 [Brassica cretica]
MSLMSSSLVLCHCLSYHTMRFVPSEGKKDSKRRRSWWQRFFFDDDDVNWLGLSDDDIVDEMSDEEKLETWKRRAEAHCEVTGRVEEDDILYEEDKTVFLLMHLRNRQFFLAILIVIPWALDFLAHDYVCTHALFGLVISSFTTVKYVKTVPLAAKTLDVRRSQKRLHLFLMMIYGGSCGPHYCCFRVREEWEIREPESICQHMVALLKVYRISDTGKAFLIILVTDIFLG